MKRGFSLLCALLLSTGSGLGCTHMDLESEEPVPVEMADFPVIDEPDEPSPVEPPPEIREAPQATELPAVGDDPDIPRTPQVVGEPVVQNPDDSMPPTNGKPTIEPVTSAEPTIAPDLPSVTNESPIVFPEPKTPASGRFAVLQRDCFVHAEASSTSDVYKNLNSGLRLWTERENENWYKVFRRKGIGFLWHECFERPTPAPRVETSEARPVQLEASPAAVPPVVEANGSDLQDQTAVAAASVAPGATPPRPQDPPAESPAPPVPSSLSPGGTSESPDVTQGFIAGVVGGLFIVSVLMGFQAVTRRRSQRRIDPTLTLSI